jgi:hypothetical protein
MKCRRRWRNAGLGFAVLAGGHDRLDARVRAEREQAQQQPSAQGVAVDHLAGGDRGELGAELGEEVGVLEHVEQVESAQQRITSSLTAAKFPSSFTRAVSRRARAMVIRSRRPVMSAVESVGRRIAA